MQWKKLANGDYKAEGKDGDFLIWRDRGVFKARYRTTDQRGHFFLPVSRTLAEAKDKCERNYYWEINNERK